MTTSNPDGASRPLIDVIIPVHDASRPVGRAVDSLLRSGMSVHGELRINLVCHNIGVDEIRSAMAPNLRAQVRFLEFSDGASSPAGPFMHGIAQSTAEYVSIMGSDDLLEEGALQAWFAAARAHDADAVIPPERHANGNKVATPPVRPFRRGALHPLKDRLAYRTAPLGLIRRELVSRLDLSMPSRLKSGSDQLFGLRLWFDGGTIVYAHDAPHYVVGADAKTRVTFTVRPAVEELMAVSELVREPWTTSQPLKVRRAIVAKTVRVHIFSAALVRTDGDRWTQADRSAVRELLAEFARVAPGYERPLSIADRRLLDALLSGDTGVPQLSGLLAARRRYGRPTTVLTRDLRGLFATDGPLRFMVAAKLL